MPRGEKFARGQTVPPMEQSPENSRDERKPGSEPKTGEPSNNTLMKKNVNKAEDEGFASETRYYAGRIASPIERRTSPPRRCPAPVPTFTGREAEIQKSFGSITRSRDKRQVCIIHGLRGVGKTQLALKTIELFRETWTHVLYINASSTEEVEITLQNIALNRGLGNAHGHTLSWLEESREPWLMMFDNADDETLDIKAYFPGGNHGSILITSRLPDILEDALDMESICRMNLTGMSHSEGLALIQKTMRRQDQVLQAEELKAATALLQEFGHLPSAVVHAGAYISHTRTTIRKYWGLLLTQRELVRRHNDGKGTKLNAYEQSARAAWKLCYDLAERNRDSRLLLWLLAYLHQDNVIEAIFERAALTMQSQKPKLAPNSLEAAAWDHVRDCLRVYSDSNGAWSSTKFSSTMNKLVAYSLIDYDEVNLSYNIHALTQEWLQATIPQSPEFALECTTTLLAQSIKSADLPRLPADHQCFTLHVNNVLLEHLSQTNSAHGSSGFAKGLSAHQRLLGEDHPDTLAYMNAFAMSYYDQSLWAEAEFIQIQILNIHKRMLGEEHPYTLTSMHNLAITYQHQGRWDQGEILQARIQAIGRQVLGEEHPHTANMKNLKANYQSQSRWDEVAQHQFHVVDLRKQVVGLEHLNTLTSMTTLALIYHSRGEWDEAQELREQLLDAYTRVLGVYHPNTLSSMNNLAMTYYYQGLLDEAESLQIRILSAHRKILGEDHPSTLTSLDNLADTYRQQDRWKEAEVLFLGALNGRKRVLGSEHPDTLSSLVNLASAYSLQDRWQEAEELELQVLDTRKRHLGDQHPDTLASMSNLVHIYSKQCRWDKVEALQLQTLKANRRTLGKDHPKTLKTMASLAHLCSKQGHFADAEPLWLEIVSITKDLLGSESPDTLIASRHLAHTYQSLGRLTQAEILLVPLLNTSRATLGSNHSNTLAIMNLLSEIYKEMVTQASPSYYDQPIQASRSLSAVNIIALAEIGLDILEIPPSLGSNNKVMINSSMVSSNESSPLRLPGPAGPQVIANVCARTKSPQEIISCLSSATCRDITPSIDEQSCDSTPLFGGSFGDVYRGRLKNRARVALKCIRTLPQRTSRIHQYAARELHVWSKLKHNHILELLGLALFRDRIAMVSPWMENGNLPNYLHDNPTADRCQLSTQIASGLAYMHVNGAIHGDLKASNVFISKDGIAKIGDFGSALKIDTTMQFSISAMPDNTLRWAAPELLMGECLPTMASDAYALGMTILEIISGNPPYWEKRDTSVVYIVTVKKEKPTRSQESFPAESESGDALWCLLLESWDHDVDKRPTVEDMYYKIKKITPLHLRPGPKGVLRSEVL